MVLLLFLVPCLYYFFTLGFTVLVGGDYNVDTVFERSILNIEVDYILLAIHQRTRIEVVRTP